MNIHNTRELRQILRNGPYAWPGGYPLFFVMDDGAALSFEAVKDNYRFVSDSIRHHLHDGWRVIGVNVNWEDSQLVCEHTNKPIPSAY